MKTERELFEAWAKKETNWDLYWSENIKQYMDHQTNGAWLAWQARVPGGYKVVHVEKVMDCLYQISDRSYVDDNVSEIKAMLEAVEK